MSSVPQVASSGEISSLELFGCRTDTPPMCSNNLSISAQALSDLPLGSFGVLPCRGSGRASASEAPQIAAAPMLRDGPFNPQHDDVAAITKSDPVVPNNGSAKCGEGSTSRRPTNEAAKRGRRREDPAKTSASATQKPSLHRIARIREQQGISERTMARRLGVDVKRYRELEDPQCDLSLSQLIAIQTALEVPIGDLLEDRQGLSRPVEERAKLLKIMKTAVAIKEAKISPRADRMAQMLCEQLVELMPELADVSGWPQFGARRGMSAVGKALQLPIDTSNILFQE